MDIVGTTKTIPCGMRTGSTGRSDKDTFLSSHMQDILNLNERLKRGPVNVVQERKRLFSKLKKQRELSLEPILDKLVQLLLTDQPSGMKHFIYDHIFDVQEIIKTSICNGWTDLKVKSNHYIQAVDLLSVQSTALHLKWKACTLKLVINTFLTCDVEDDDDEMNLELQASEMIYNMMKQDVSLCGLTVLDEKNEKAYAIFDSQLKEMILFDQSGFTFETAVNNLNLIPRKDLVYFCRKGK
jgi:hypothetical protein